MKRFRIIILGICMVIALNASAIPSPLGGNDEKIFDELSKSRDDLLQQISDIKEIIDRDHRTVDIRSIQAQIADLELSIKSNPNDPDKPKLLEQFKRDLADATQAVTDRDTN